MRVTICNLRCAFKHISQIKSSAGSVLLKVTPLSTHHSTKPICSKSAPVTSSLR